MGSRFVIRSVAALLGAASLSACLGEFRSQPPFSLLLALVAFGPRLEVEARYLVGSGLTIENQSTGEQISVSPNTVASFANVAEDQPYSLQIVTQPSGPTQQCSFVGPSSGILNGEAIVSLECSATIVSTNPPLPGILKNDQAIVLYFNRSMTPGNCQIDPNLAVTTLGPTPAFPADYSWSQTNAANDTLTIAAPPWNIFTAFGGAMATLMNCVDANGDPPAAALAATEIYVLDALRVRYVSRSGADVATNGESASSPMASISFAIADLQTDTTCAGAGQQCAVLVAGTASGATYTDTFNMINSLWVTAGFSPDFATLDGALYPVTIRSPAGCPLGANVFNDPCTTVRFPAATLIDAALQGATIQAPVGQNFSTAVSLLGNGVIRFTAMVGSDAVTESSALFVSGGGTIDSSAMVGGVAPTSLGVALRNGAGVADAILASSVINATTLDGAMSSAGVLVDLNSRGFVGASFIYGGAGTVTSRGVEILGTPAAVGFRVYNNVIAAGRADRTTVSAAALYLNETSNRVQAVHNTMFAYSSTEAFGVHSRAPVGFSSPDIQNNIIMSDLHCYFEEDAAAAPIEYAYNALFCPVSLYRDNLLTDFDTIALVETNLFYFNNVNVLPVFADDTDLEGGQELTTDAPCSIVEGGTPAFTGLISTDRLGRARTAPVSMGAYEQDGGCAP